ILWLDLGGFAKERNRVDEVIHRSQSLSAEEQHVGLQSARMIDTVERLDHPAGKLVAGVGPARHLVTEDGDQVEIALGFSENLLSGDATEIRHVRCEPTLE